MNSNIVVPISESYELQLHNDIINKCKKRFKIHTVNVLNNNDIEIIVNHIAFVIKFVDYNNQLNILLNVQDQYFQFQTVEQLVNFLELFELS